VNMTRHSPIRWALSTSVALAIVLSSCGETSDEGAGPESPGPQATKEATPSPTPQPTPIPPIVQTGRGNQATPAFNLESGLAIFRNSYQGTSNFIADLKSASSGEDVGTAANELNTSSSSRGIHVEAGEYLLNVTAEGPWTIRVEQPRPTTGPGISASPVTGSGNVIAGPFFASAGLLRASTKHGTSSNFIVDLLDAEGNDVATVANDLEEAQSSTALQVPDDGVYWLNITADGSWSITFA
jgi:hypothetical protein